MSLVSTRAATTRITRPRVAVRPLRPEDAPRLAALARELGEPGSAPDWARLLAQREVVAIGAEMDGALAGYAVATVRHSFGSGVPIGWIKLFGVGLAWRGRGVGRALAEALLLRVREAGARRARTIVPLHDRELDPFFRDIGFATEPLVCLGRSL